MSAPVPQSLATARLSLRRLQPGDADALIAYRSLPAVARYQYWDTFGPAEAAQLIASQTGTEPGMPGTWSQFAIIQTATGRLIGDCGLHTLAHDPRQFEIGITLAPRQQGFAYADEAGTLLLDYAFGPLNMHRALAIIDELNRPAIALCRRLGFRQEAHHVENQWFKGRWSSEYEFALLQREWQSRPDKTSA